VPISFSKNFHSIHIIFSKQEENSLPATISPPIQGMALARKVIGAACRAVQDDINNDHLQSFLTRSQAAQEAPIADSLPKPSKGKEVIINNYFNLFL
jgi:hypothetical protein